MIVVNAKETKDPSGLSQLLLGKKATNDTQFAKFLEAFNLNGMFKDEDFNLETALQKIIVSTDKEGKKLDSRLSVVDNKKTLTRTSENRDVSSSKNTKEVLKETTLMHLLQGESVNTQVIERVLTQKVQTEVLADDESQFLHPKMINTLDPKDIKIVINAAKEYLKEQIDTIVKEQNIDVKTVPQTLKGLSEMAKKLGVNLEKITLDEIPLPSTPKTKELLSLTKESMPLLDMKKQELVSPLVSLKSALIAKEKPALKKEEPLKNALHVSVKDSAETEEKSNPRAVALAKETPNTQTLKVSTTAVRTEVSDTKFSEVVSAENTTKPRAVDPLSELLHGEKRSDTQESSMKTNPMDTKVSQSSFVNVPASDSLEVKAKEAQQMVRHFATDLKEAVENYKPPFTRLKMTLNPAKLGEVDVTLIQRGNNVHINVSSNNTAVTLLAHNVNELKTQLANNGVVNTSMQFSTSHGEHQQQEGRHQQFAQAYHDFDQLSEEELEMITSMEIILPRYV
jgi:flagellar hook-length control protein FliK